MALMSDKGGRGLAAPVAASGSGAVLMADSAHGPDLSGVSEAMRPLAELCLSPDAQTPFTLAIVGGRGAGKSFALRRLIERVNRKTGAARAVVAEVDASAGSADPAGAVAAAVFAALERDNGGANHSALADEAAQAAVDPRQAAAHAADRHDEIIARLEQERRARDEVEGRRARLVDALLFETPGSRLDSFVRARRAAIEARLRRFGFVEGDADMNYRSLVRDLSGPSGASRLGLFVRAIFAYRGQKGLIGLAFFAFALAFMLDRLRHPDIDAGLRGLIAQTAPALDWLGAHVEAAEYAVEGLVAFGVLALCLNLWRAANFTGLLFRGLRLLKADIRERRRELDASAARLERRVSTLQLEADSAQQRADAMLKRAGGGAPTTRPPGPAFAAPDPSGAARAFMAELGRAMAAAAAPPRLVITLDHLDALPLAEARRFLETAVRLAGSGAVVVAALDISRFGAEARAVAENLFEAVFDVEGLGGEGLAARLLSLPAATPLGEIDGPPLTTPLDALELRHLQAASGLIGPRPRALKRFYNAYRLARLGPAARPALAMSLAALMARDPGVAAAWRWALTGEGELTPPPELQPAFDALGLAGTGKAAAREALGVAGRWVGWDKYPA